MGYGGKCEQVQEAVGVGGAAANAKSHGKQRRLASQDIDS